MNEQEFIKHAIRCIQKGFYINIYDYERYKRQHISQELEDNTKYQGFETLKFYNPEDDVLLIMVDSIAPEGMRDLLPDANVYDFEYCYAAELLPPPIVVPVDAVFPERLRREDYRFVKSRLPGNFGFYWSLV